MVFNRRNETSLGQVAFAQEVESDIKLLLESDTLQTTLHLQPPLELRKVSS
jgi:hypothetical protein